MYCQLNSKIIRNTLVLGLRQCRIRDTKRLYLDYSSNVAGVRRLCINILLFDICSISVESDLRYRSYALLQNSLKLIRSINHYTSPLLRTRYTV